MIRSGIAWGKISRYSAYTMDRESRPPNLKPSECSEHESGVFEESTHFFSLEFWRESPSTDKDGAIWRGRIVHSQSGEHRYVRFFSELIRFIRHYLHP
jgi:hypothetical protein